MVAEVDESPASEGVLRRACDEALLRNILDSHFGPHGKEPHICGYHKLRHRHSGRYHWVDFHITVPPDWNIDRGHRVASAIEYEIELALGEGNATAHVEPCTEPHCAACGRVEPRSHEVHEAIPLRSSETAK